MPDRRKPGVADDPPLESHAPEELKPDPQKEKRVVFEEPGSAMRLAEGGAGRKIPPPDE